MSLELSARFVEQDYCRLCLSSIYELHALFPKGPNESNVILMSKISLLAEIILIPTEELNARICSRCMQQLEDFDSFRRRCKDSDNQIRKIRALQKWNDPSSEIAVASKNTQPQGQEQVKFGGIFDLMLYSEYYTAALEEYYMLFDGCVYRKESLLVWRCELPNCPCQLLVENNFSKFWIYGAHNHAKLTSDQRKFTQMDQRVCAFLNKLRNQMDGITDEMQDKTARSICAQQNLVLDPQQTVPSNSESSVIQYSTEGDKPSIVVNFHRYYKEAVNSDVIPSQIYWRCNDKNCLGMILTTADLRSYKVCKDHNHVPKSVTDRSSIQIDFPVRVAALPMNHTQPSESTTAHIQSPNAEASTSRPSNVPIAPKSTFPESTPVRVNATKQAEPNDTTACSISMTLPKNQSLMAFYKDIKNYYMYLFLFLYQREVCYSSPTNSEVLWKCMVTKCPGTMIVFPSLKYAPGLAHNHGPMNWPMGNLTKVPSAEALTKPIIVSEISFYRCSTNEGICLLYKQFIYSVLSFLSTDAIAWKCRNIGCDGQLRSGMQFEYLTTVKNHNHGPVLELTVNVESYLTVPDALMELKAQNLVKLNCPQLQDKIEKRIAAELRSKRNKNSLKKRRKSTWC
ncbi:uncharacterized protein LOC135704310 [Ochlerotatus camptorhynchus]|uniref:uncharacterized protein LOC135704310 n=1 Tax=Ochlerotatus camptorhynchus TaxID=644619 RepID=UPI0031DDD397